MTQPAPAGPQNRLNDEPNAVDNESVLKTQQRLWQAYYRINKIKPRPDLALITGGPCCRPAARLGAGGVGGLTCRVRCWRTRPATCSSCAAGLPLRPGTLLPRCALRCTHR